MVPKGIVKITEYYNKIEMNRLWSMECFRAAKLGRGDLAAQFTPRKASCSRTIDKAIGRLRAALDEHDKAQLARE